MSKIIFNENTKSFLYLILGGLLFSNILLIKINKLNNQKETQLVYTQSINSCYYSLTKKSNISEEEKSRFCSDYAQGLTDTFADISSQMDVLNDKKYDLINVNLKEYK